MGSQAGLASSGGPTAGGQCLPQVGHELWSLWGVHQLGGHVPGTCLRKPHDSEGGQMGRGRQARSAQGSKGPRNEAMRKDAPPASSGRCEHTCEHVIQEVRGSHLMTELHKQLHTGSQVCAVGAKGTPMPHPMLARVPGQGPMPWMPFRSNFGPQSSKGRSGGQLHDNGLCDSAPRPARASSSRNISCRSVLGEPLKAPLLHLGRD